MHLPKPLTSTPTSYLDDTIGVHSLWAAMFSADKNTAVRHSFQALKSFKPLPPRLSLPSTHVSSAENASRTGAMHVSTIRSPQWLRIWTPKCRRPLSALGPGPRVWEAKLSRVLRAPSSAPNSAQAGVIDAERPRQDHANGSSPHLRSRVIVR